MKLMVTGAAGFIGSAVVRMAMDLGHEVVSIDALTYAACLDNLAPVAERPGHVFVQADIRDGVAMAELFEGHAPDAVLHLAAETHVDRSIDGPMAFIDTNVTGTATLLEAARRHWEARGRPEGFRFLHVSTDEVFGTLGPEDPAFHEETPYAPNSPYAASKAASDHLARAWHETYGLPVMVSNCSNNYGPYQFPEKLIPVVILAALEEREIPVYGAGSNIRDWLHVEDHAAALLRIIEAGRPGRSYAVGADNECRNIDLVHEICALLDARRPRANGAPHAELIGFVADRPGHDLRYAIDARRIRDELGWQPRIAPRQGLAQTVDWYLDNCDWWQALRARDGVGQRLGQGR